MTLQQRVSVGLLAAVLLTTSAAPAVAGSITYWISDSAAGFARNISGTITTDGTLGVLTVDDILDWDLLLQDPYESVAFTGVLSGWNSQVTLVGSSLLATPDELWWISHDGDQFRFLGLFGPGIVSPDYAWSLTGMNGGILHSYMTVYGQPCCVQEFEPATERRVGIAPIPEPATLIMLGIGLAAAGLRHRRCSPTTSR